MEPISSAARSNLLQLLLRINGILRLHRLWEKPYVSVASTEPAKGAAGKAQPFFSEDNDATLGSFHREMKHYPHLSVYKQ